MKFVLKTSMILVYCALTVLAKGGGGGGGGGRGSSGGSSEGSSGGRGSTGSTDGSTGSAGSKGSAGSTPNSVSSKGGTGTFSEGAPPAYSSTRSSYSSYAPVYSGGYSPASRYGYYGYYNPPMLYFFIMSPFFFYGYNSAYHRYNQQNGYYYAPQITEQGSNTDNVIINGTANSGKDDNYHYAFNISTNNQFPIVDHAFYSSSDPNARTADFVYRLQTSQIIEFDDVNQNGFYDNNEPILSVTSLQNLQWQTFQVSNITVPNNNTQFYLQTSTFANATYNNTATTTTGSPSFGVRITYRSSNLQLNNTAPIVMQPNSLEYDFAVEGFPNIIASTRPTAKLAFAQVLSSNANVPFGFDINGTTPVDVANQIKTNQTYGISIGDYTQGRLEFQTTAYITDVNSYSAGWTTTDANTLAGIPAYVSSDWIWGPNAPASNRTNKLLFVTVPGYVNTNTSINAAYSSFGFLDTDVMDALANPNAASNLHMNNWMSLLVASIVAVYFITF